VAAEEKGPIGMSELGSPSVSRRRLAAELRRLREEHSLTGEDVAENLGWSASKLSRIETARIGIKAADLARLLDEYDVAAEHKAELLRLVGKPRSRGWWEAYTDSLPEKFAHYIVMESEAESIAAWSTELVPGLLQTPDFARAAIGAHLAATAAISASEIERRVQTRLKRQRILTSDPRKDLASVLDESVLLRHVHSARIMRDQLAHLIKMSEQPNVTIRVLPLDGAHPIGSGAFMLLKFAPIPEIGPVSDIVFIEELTGNALYIDDDGETQRYQLGFGQLVADSLDPEKSRELIARTIRDRWSD
jgi:transcriptional regulator with XRE-family HTH domain